MFSARQSGFSGKSERRLVFQRAPSAPSDSSSASVPNPSPEKVKVEKDTKERLESLKALMPKSPFLAPLRNFLNGLDAKLENVPKEERAAFIQHANEFLNGIEQAFGAGYLQTVAKYPKLRSRIGDILAKIDDEPELRKIFESAGVEAGDMQTVIDGCKRLRDIEQSNKTHLDAIQGIMNEHPEAFKGLLQNVMLSLPEYSTEVESALYEGLEQFKGAGEWVKKGRTVVRGFLDSLSFIKDKEGFADRITLAIVTWILNLIASMEGKAFGLADQWATPAKEALKIIEKVQARALVKKAVGDKFDQEVFDKVFEEKGKGNIVANYKAAVGAQEKDKQSSDLASKVNVDDWGEEGERPIVQMGEVPSIEKGDKGWTLALTSELVDADSGALKSGEAAVQTLKAAYAEFREKDVSKVSIGGAVEVNKDAKSITVPAGMSIDAIRNIYKVVEENSRIKTFLQNDFDGGALFKIDPDGKFTVNDKGLNEIARSGEIVVVIDEEDKSLGDLETGGKEVTLGFKNDKWTVRVPK